MKLKTINLLGFKSFAQRTIIEIKDGITGIIGPNGCGKSNIIDAIKWVMGEQASKNLRADDPRDIIFAGSEKQKSPSMAEVIMTFENDGIKCPPEYLHLKEISIGRRIFKDGEREYIINGEQCRLKDVIKFLFAIGFGAKNYSIIQQDKRDKIIHADPDSLREILEENAGITIFKTRQKEAEKRLLDSEEKLKSLKNLESEISRQYKSLELQVKKAEEREELSKKIFVLEKKLLEKHVFHYKKQKESILNVLSQEKNVYEKNQIERAKLASTLNKFETEYNTISKDLKTNEDLYDEEKIELTKLQERLKNLHSLKEKFQDEKKKYAEDIKSHQNLIFEENLKLKDFSSQIEAVDKKSSELDNIIKKKLEDHDIIQEKNLVFESKKEALLSEKSAVLTSEKDILIERKLTETDISKRKRDSMTKEESLSKQKDALEDILKKIDSSQKTLDSNKNKNASIVEKKLLLVKKRDSIQKEKEELENDKERIKQNYLEKNASFESLKKLIDSNTGLSDGLVSLKETLGHLVYDYTHNAIKLEKEIGLTLEKALPEIFQTVLLKDNSDLLDFLDKIEENQIQKVSLLSDTHVSELSSSQKSKKEHILKKYKTISPSNKVISCHCASLLKIIDRVLIFNDDLELFECIEKENLQNDCFILISERGTLYQNGFISCGEDGESSQSIVSQKFEIEKLKEDKTKLEEELAQLENTCLKKRLALEEIDIELKAITESLQEDKILETKHVTLLESLILEKEKSSSDILLLKESLLENTKTIERLNDELKKQSEKESLLEKEKERLKSDLEDLESQFSSEKERANELSNEISKVKEERAVFGERIENLHRSYEESLKHSKFLDDNLKKHMDLSEKLSKEMDDSDNSQKNLQDEITAINKRTSELESVITKLNNDGESLFAKMKALKSKVENSSVENNKHKNIIEEKNLELARNETILEASFKDAQERFHMSQEDFDKIEARPEDEKTLQNDIQSFKVKVESIGPVNENAIEEFKAIKDRFTFLKDQKEDITTSIHELRKSIETIVETTKKHFLEHLKKVNFEFQNIFPILFPQGHGELNLSNPEDILNSGVEISVKLPGKKLKNMKLFSGGEKALTAISLILSLLKTQPTPFCFLDEVDAPLDEANIGRFNKVLETLSDQFQFIVITHNRRTMEILDTIYGVSMKQAGVSSMVSVDLTDAPDYLKKKNVRETKSGALAN